VYEGMNQYNGEKLAARAGLLSFKQQLDNLALTAASMDVESGRNWRPIRDTADGAPFLYEVPGQYGQLRRSASDFYAEGTLIWLDADVTIRRLTHDQKSLDDFCKLWGNGDDETSVPVLNPYDEAEVIALLQSVAPYDWAGFFNERIATVEPRAPLGGITGAGYHLAYTDSESDLEKGRDGFSKTADARWSIGAILGDDGTVRDVLTDSPAFRAGLAPDMKIVAVDGKRFSGDELDAALKRHKGGTTAIEMIVTNADFFSVVHVEAHDGPRYPHLVRDSAVPDELGKIYAPLTYKPSPEPSAAL
jgi:predicted metalloprotease with PDZ domain